MDESSVPRMPTFVRQLRARLSGRRTGHTSSFGNGASGSSQSQSGYFCRTCGTGFEGRHGTCPQCGGGMIERGVDPR